MAVPGYSDFHLQVDPGAIKATYLRKENGQKIEKTGPDRSTEVNFDFSTYFKNILPIENEDIEKEPPENYAKEHKELGAYLFSFLFPKPIADFFHESYYHSIEIDRRSGMRIRLQVNDKKLSNVAWEFLYDDTLDRYLCTEITTPFTRYYDGLPKLINLVNNTEEERTKRNIVVKTLFVSANAMQ